MTINFENVMKYKSDEELIGIIFTQGEYVPLAIKAAEEQIKKRGIDKETVSKIKEELEKKIKVQNKTDLNKINRSTRVFNVIIDWIVISLVYVIICFVLSLIGPLESTEDIIFDIHFFISFFEPLYSTEDIIFDIIITVSYFGYYIFMEYKFEKTIGKFITKTKVSRVDDRRVGLGDIIVRTFCRLIPFDGLSYVFTMNGFHDRFSGTKLVNDKTI